MWLWLAYIAFLRKRLQLPVKYLTALCREHNKLHPLLTTILPLRSRTGLQILFFGTGGKAVPIHWCRTYEVDYRLQPQTALCLGLFPGSQAAFVFQTPQG